MDRTICEHCHDAIVSAMSEPEGKTLQFNAAPRMAWKMVNVTDVHTIAAPIEIYELHRLTCKVINNKE